MAPIRRQYRVYVLSFFFQLSFLNCVCRQFAWSYFCFFEFKAQSSYCPPETAKLTFKSQAEVGHELNTLSDINYSPPEAVFPMWVCNYSYVCKGQCHQCTEQVSVWSFKNCHHIFIIHIGCPKRKLADSSY